MFMSSRGARNDDGLSVAQSGVCKVSKDTGRFIWSLRTVTTLASIGAVSGLFTGMLGVGGGFIIVPALGYFSELRMHSRSEEHTSELQSLMRISYAVFCLKKKKKKHIEIRTCTNSATQ